MTLPDERFRAVVRTQEFLRDLLDPRKTPRIPRHIRERAYGCLRHYPGYYHMEDVAESCPKHFEALSESEKEEFLNARKI